MKNVIIAVLLLVIVVGGGYIFVGKDALTRSGDSMTASSADATTEEETMEEVPTYESQTTLGKSVEGNNIVAHHFGFGDKEVLFIGGIHGGYGWNTVSLAHELIDYLSVNESAVPEGVKVTVIPVMNPDGLERVVRSTGRFDASTAPTARAEIIKGRLNTNDVDLNRNFDCEWKSEGTWQSTKVSGGSAPFSEPEAQAIRDYIAAHQVSAAVVWYSAAGGVFASSCGEILPETTELTNLYADAAEYKAYEEFDFYAITGDMVNWFAKNDIPAISVLLSDHEDAEWAKNRKGILAVVEYVGKAASTETE